MISMMMDTSGTHNSFNLSKSEVGVIQEKNESIQTFIHP